MNIIAERIERPLKQFLRNFQQHPFDYFYEEDARSLLFVDLWREWEGERARFKWEASPHPDAREVWSVPVKAEYPQYGENRRFDIAILDTGGDHDNLYNLPVRAAIEIKLGSELIGSDQAAGFKADMEKLRRYGKIEAEGRPFLGIAMCLYPIKRDRNRTPEELFQQWYFEKGAKQDLQTTIQNLRLADDHIYGIVASPNSEECIYCLAERTGRGE